MTAADTDRQAHVTVFNELVRALRAAKYPSC